MDLNEITSLYDNFFSDNSNNLSDQNYFQNQFCNQTTFSNNSNNYFPNYVDNNTSSNYNLVNIDNYAVVNNNQDQYNINNTNNRPPFLRIIKQRKTANKKERRRTQSINNAFSDLRDCIPSIPADTKLSKIKTLRLATSYIAYLSEILANDTNSNNIHDFQVNLATLNSKKSLNFNSVSLQNKNIAINNIGPLDNCSSALSSTSQFYLSNKNNDTNFSNIEKEMNSTNIQSKSSSAPLVTKGRTGWPQYVWALELKQE